MNLICVHCVASTACLVRTQIVSLVNKMATALLEHAFPKRWARGRVIGCLPVVSIGMLTVGLRGTATLGCSLLLGEEITGHLQLPLISHRVRLEPGERPAGGWCPALWKHKETETNVFQPSSTTLCPFTVLNMRVQIDLVHSPPQPNHLFSLKTDSFMCCYHVIMCCCSAGSYSISETFTSRQKG